MSAATVGKPSATSPDLSGKVSRFSALMGKSVSETPASLLFANKLPDALRKEQTTNSNRNNEKRYGTILSPFPPVPSSYKERPSTAPLQLATAVDGTDSHLHTSNKVPICSPLGERDLNVWSTRNNDDVNKLKIGYMQPAALTAHEDNNRTIYEYTLRTSTNDTKEVQEVQEVQDHYLSTTLALINAPHQLLHPNTIPTPPTAGAAAALNPENPAAAIALAFDALRPVEGVLIEPLLTYTNSSGAVAWTPESERKEREQLLREEEAVDETEPPRRDKDSAAPRVNEVARLEPKTNGILVEQQREEELEERRQEQHRRQQQQKNTQPAALASPPTSYSSASNTSYTSSPSSPLSSKPRSPVFEKFGFLGRRRKNKAASDLSSTASPFSLSPTSSMGASVDVARFNRPEQKVQQVMPQTEVPRGAINGGGRRVAVRCRGIPAEIDVMNETTAVDVLLGFVDQTNHSININTSKLVESYTQLGLERRLRRYERIRDVMNSWDSDSQNALIISPDHAEADPDLDLATVSLTEEAPAGFELVLYHSYRPGKWSKRFVTLDKNGQIFSSKKQGQRPGAKDSTNLCHLSDYDIFMPTEAQMRKQLKPPKKYCYAIKSMQKTTIFVNKDSYVHFFCTEDAGTARKFHNYVHAWRSWHMVTKILQLHQKKKEREAEPPPQIPLVTHEPKKAVGHVRVNGHKVKVSVDESPYAIGAFQPLLNLQRFDKPLDEFGQDWVPEGKRRSVSQAPQSKQEPLLQIDTELPFDSKGLLGDAYEERKQAQRQQERKTSQSAVHGSGPVNGGTAAPGNLALRGPAPRAPGDAKEQQPKPEEKPSRSWFPSAVEHTLRKQKERPPPPDPRPNTLSGALSQYERDSRSRRHYQQQQQRGGGGQRSEPLVNLAPKFVEAPQWRREGRGRGVDAPEGTLLVDMATGPTKIPGAKIFDAPPKNLVRRGVDNNNHSAPPLISQVPSNSSIRSLAQLQRQLSISEGRGGGGGPAPVGMLSRRGTVSSRRGGSGGTGGVGDASDLPALPLLPINGGGGPGPGSRDGSGMPLLHRGPMTSSRERVGSGEHRPSTTSSGHSGVGGGRAEIGVRDQHHPSLSLRSRDGGGGVGGREYPPLSGGNRGR